MGVLDRHNAVRKYMAGFITFLLSLVSWACNTVELSDKKMPVDSEVEMNSVGAMRLENPEVGYSLLYPGNWQVKGQVVATEFASGAQCESVEVVDFQPPPESGPTAVVLHSFAQICTKRLTDSSTLDDFMRQTYGDAFAAQFQRIELDGIQAYQATSEDRNTIFLQANDYRILIISSVVADPDKRSERRSQVQEILESFSIVQR